MALAIDASTPAFVSTTSTAVATQTTASFTPPVGSLLVVPYVNPDSATALTKPTNTGGAVTWDAAIAVSQTTGVGVAAGIWRGLVTTSASMTVSVTLGSALAHWGFGVVVVTGQAATQNGATNKGTGTTSLASITIASLVGANSLVLGAGAQFSNATNPTPGSGQSTSFNGNAFTLSDGTVGEDGWAQYLTGMNLAAGSSATINDTAPTCTWGMAVLEILAPAVPGFEFGTIPKQQISSFGSMPRGT